MKTRDWKILTTTTLLALAMFGVTPSAGAATPAYLNEMPSVARVLSEVQGTNALDTAARQLGVFDKLMDIMETFEGNRTFLNQQTPAETQLRQSYFMAELQIEGSANQLLRNKKSSATGTNSPSAKFTNERWAYSEDTAYVLNKFFSPQLQSAYRTAAQKENQTSQAGNQATGTPVAQGNQNRVAANSGAGETASSGIVPAAQPAANIDPAVQPATNVLATIESIGIIAISMVTLLGLGLLTFWIWMIIDCLVHEHDNKIAWLSLIIFVNWVGALIYYAARRSARRRESRQKAVA